MAVPAAHMREAAVRIGSTRAHRGTSCCRWPRASRPGTLARMSEVLAAELPCRRRRIAALSGPNLAPEIARGMPASSVVGATDDAVGERVVAALGGPTFRLYRNRDLVGVELAGALKNIVAIAAGAVEALGLGDNARGRDRHAGPRGDHPPGGRGRSVAADLRGARGHRRHPRHGRLAAVPEPPAGHGVARGRPWAETEASFGVSPRVPTP